MFDNKKEPQDIFEGVEPPVNLPVSPEAATSVSGSLPRPVVSAPSKVAAPQLTPPTANQPIVMAPVVPGTTPPPTGKIVDDADLASGGHLWKTILIVVIAFVAMGLAAFLAYRLMNPADDATTGPEGETAGETDQNTDLPDGKGDGGAVIEEPDVQIVIDTDGDGLTNTEEQQAGTNVSKPDTDSDLLGDREEVQVYGTDPLRADTDGDGFTDGQEVRSGYNPNGAGKILEIPTAQ